jgi:hypothetical protein
MRHAQRNRRENSSARLAKLPDQTLLWTSWLAIHIRLELDSNSAKTISNAWITFRHDKTSIILNLVIMLLLVLGLILKMCRWRFLKIPTETIQSGQSLNELPVTGKRAGRSSRPDSRRARDFFGLYPTGAFNILCSRTVTTFPHE